MRVFVALDIDDAIRARLEQFLDGVRGFAPEARWVRPESMHVTLKFIGEKSSEAVDEIKQALGAHPGWQRSRFHFAVMDSFLPRKRLVFSGLALRPARNWPLWQSRWMRLRLALAFREKNTSSARI